MYCLLYTIHFIIFFSIFFFLQYMYRSNAGVCSACPHNTRRYPNSISDLDSTSVTQCICKKDYFSLNTTSCSECVSGGKCEGGHQQPYPKEGFYGHQTTDIPIFMPCMNQYACLGGKNFSCSEGWEGVLCAQPVDGFFKFGISSVECPHASGTSLRLGTRKTELTVICILLSTSVCLWILLYVSKTSSKLWHLLQLLALASKINHVHWPIIQHNFFIVLSHTVLLDFRPLARLLVGCDTGVSGGDMLEVMLGIGPTAVATVGVVIWTAKSQDLNRLTSLRAALILVLTSLEMFACRTVCLCITLLVCTSYVYCLIVPRPSRETLQRPGSCVLGGSAQDRCLSCWHIPHSMGFLTCLVISKRETVTLKNYQRCHYRVDRRLCAIRVGGLCGVRHRSTF